MHKKLSGVVYNYPIGGELTFEGLCVKKYISTYNMSFTNRTISFHTLIIFNDFIQMKYCTIVHTRSVQSYSFELLTRIKKIIYIQIRFVISKHAHANPRVSFKFKETKTPDLPQSPLLNNLVHKPTPPCQLPT